MLQRACPGMSFAPSVVPGRVTVFASARRVGNVPHAVADINAPIQGGPDTTGFAGKTSNPDVNREEARKYYRTVYGHAEWEQHRSQKRLINRLLSIPKSHILQNIGPSLAWVTAVSSGLIFYMYAHDQGAFPEAFPSLRVNPSATLFASTTGMALSLLLVFRTNASYARWDEARKMWGSLLNRSRDLSRQGTSWFPSDKPETLEALARWTVAFAKLLRIHLQPEVTVESELAGVLSPAELEGVKSASHRPVFALHALSQVIKNTPMDPIEEFQMSANLTQFHDILGGCERLLRAPIPLSYTRHTARFLFLWLTILPFSLYPSLDVWTLPTVLAISGSLCAIEEIGVQIEEPFGILPLEVICDRIQTDVRNTVIADAYTKAVLLNSMKRPVIASNAGGDGGEEQSTSKVLSVGTGAFAAGKDGSQTVSKSFASSEQELSDFDGMLEEFSKKANARMSEIREVLKKFQEPV